MPPNDPSPRHPRSSTETERTLIADEEQHPTSSSRAASPARTLVDTSTPTPYRGFPSQAEYLAALREWAEEKRYLQPSTTTLTGYYGKETLQAYADRPRHEFGISRKLREMKEKKQGRKQSLA